MKTSHYALVLLACASACAAKDHPDYQNGKILQMESTSCGLQEKSSKTVAGEIFGTDGQHKKTQEEHECHVAFLGPVRAGKAEIGLEFTAPHPTFWRVAFPPEDWTPRHPEARTASNRGEKDKAGVPVPEKIVDK